MCLLATGTILGFSAFLTLSTSARGAAAGDEVSLLVGDSLIDTIAVGVIVLMGLVLAVMARRRLRPA